MQSSRLGMVGRFVLALLSVLMLGALVASAAQAEPTRGLEWKVAGSVLKEFETREVTVKAFTPIKLEGGGVVVRCEEAALGSGSTIFNAFGEAVSETTLELSKCEVTGNGEKCTKVKEPIKTKNIKSYFDLNDEGEKPGNKILTDWDPAAGTEKEYVEFKFEGEKCKFANTVVKNLALGSLYTDPKVGTGKEEEVQLGKLPEETTSYLYKFPGASEIVSSAFLWSSEKKWALFKPKQLTAFGGEAKLEGTLLILLRTGAKFGLTETGK